MKLVGSLTSPYVRKIRVMLIEKGMPFEFEKDSPWEAGTHVPDYNPLGKVPALVSSQGEMFFDSNIIAEHLEIIGPEPALLPEDRRAALPVRQTVMLSDGICDAGVALFLEAKRPAEKQDAAWIARQRGKVDRGLTVLARQLSGKEWLCGNSMSLADIATGCMLMWFDFRAIHPKWRQAYPVLAQFADKLATRPSFAQTIPVA